MLLLIKSRSAGDADQIESTYIGFGFLVDLGNLVKGLVVGGPVRGFDDSSGPEGIEVA